MKLCAGQGERQRERLRERVASDKCRWERNEIKMKRKRLTIWAYLWNERKIEIHPGNGQIKIDVGAFRLVIEIYCVIWDFFGFYKVTKMFTHKTGISYVFFFINFFIAHLWINIIKQLGQQSKLHNNSLKNERIMKRARQQYPKFSNKCH